MAGKKFEPDDMELFQKEMKGVRPIQAPPRSPSRPPKPDPVPVQRDKDERQVLKELLDDPGAEEGLETGEELSFLRSGYQKKYLSRLRRGRYAVTDHLDLHHMNVDTARQALLEFLAHSIRSNHGCVRVVHGKGLRSKGEPKLKQMANHVLRRHRAVVAFSSCRPADGGTGAVLVLLRDRPTVT